jgi:hypothetical protein
MKGSKFIGDTKGNRDLNHNLSKGGHGGSGESHSKGAGGGKFVGDTKGNRDLPINRTAGAK